jgi:hypothetical protein
MPGRSKRRTPQVSPGIDVIEAAEENARERLAALAVEVQQNQSVIHDLQHQLDKDRAVNTERFSQQSEQFHSLRQQQTEQFSDLRGILSELRESVRIVVGNGNGESNGPEDNNGPPAAPTEGPKSEKEQREANGKLPRRAKEKNSNPLRPEGGPNGPPLTDSEKELQRQIDEMTKNGTFNDHQGNRDHEPRDDVPHFDLRTPPFSPREETQRPQRPKKHSGTRRSKKNREKDPYGSSSDSSESSVDSSSDEDDKKGKKKKECLFIDHGAANSLIGKINMGKPSMRIRPPIFKGEETESVKSWIYQFRQAAQLNCWNDELARISAPAFLQDYALKWYEKTGRKKASIHGLLKALEKEFQAPYEERDAWRMLKMRIQLPGEPIEKYVRDMMNISTKIVNIDTQQHIELIMGGLLPVFRSMLSGTKIKNIQELLGKLRQLEADNVGKGDSRVLAISGTPKIVEDSQASEKLDEILAFMKENERIQRMRRDRITRTSNGNIVCFRCSKEGHFARDCPRGRNPSDRKQEDTQEDSKTRPKKEGGKKVVNVIDYEASIEDLN